MGNPLHVAFPSFYRPRREAPYNLGPLPTRFMCLRCTAPFRLLPSGFRLWPEIFTTTHSNRGRGRGRARGRFGQGQGGRGPTYNNNSQFRPQNGSQRGTFAIRGSFHSGPSRQNATECGYCGKLGHHEEECRKKMRESTSTSRQLTNYAHNSDYEEYTGM